MASTINISGGISLLTGGLGKINFLTEWYVGLALCIMLLLIITRDINKWRIWSLPVSLFWLIIGVKPSIEYLMIIIISAIMFAMYVVSWQQISNVISSPSSDLKWAKEMVRQEKRAAKRDSYKTSLFDPLVEKLKAQNAATKAMINLGAKQDYRSQRDKTKVDERQKAQEYADKNYDKNYQRKLFKRQKASDMEHSHKRTHKRHNVNQAIETLKKHEEAYKKAYADSVAKYGKTEADRLHQALWRRRKKKK